jgi:hypothetical protein
MTKGTPSHQPGPAQGKGAEQSSREDESTPDLRNIVANVERTLRRLAESDRDIPADVAIQLAAAQKDPWTLRELARRLTSETDCLLGYHPCTGPERSNLRYAVSDLYTHWLSDASDAPTGTNGLGAK